MAAEEGIGMKFILEITLGNDAMQTPRHVEDALRTVADNGVARLGADDLAIDRGAIHDTNGNVVGEWAVVPTFGDPHLFVGVGHCKLCGHHGQDCTGSRAEVTA